MNIHAKECPGEVHAGKSEQPGKRAGRKSRRKDGTRTVTPPAMGGEHQAVQQTPNDEVQAGAMPESADEHGDEKVHIDAGNGDT